MQLTVFVVFYVHNVIHNVVDNSKFVTFVITGRNEVVAKVMFLHVCVILFTGGSPGRENPPRAGRTPPPGRENPPGADTPPGADPPRAAHSSIRSTSGRYASYWNAFLFTMFFIMSLITVNCDLLSLIIAWKAKLLYMNDIMNDKRPFPLHEQSWGNSFAKYSFDSLLIPTSG